MAMTHARHLAVAFILAACLVACGDGTLRPVGDALDMGTDAPPDMGAVDMPALPECTNGIQDGTETDTDCGGAMCAPCAEGHACSVAADCQTSAPSPWSVCAPDASCAVDGEQVRDVPTVACAEGVCTRLANEERRACVVADPEGMSCAPDVASDFSLCTPQEATGDPCGLSGTQSRTVTRFACASGTCAQTAQSETRDCMLSDGVACAVPEAEDWGVCSFPSSCALEGARARNQSTFTCVMGACTETEERVTEPCARETDANDCRGGNGAQCAAGACVNRTPGCMGDDECDDADACTMDACRNGACVHTPRDGDSDGFGCDVDCDDTNPSVHPRSSVRPVGYRRNTHTRPGGAVSYDYDCNGVIEKRWVNFRGPCDMADPGSCRGSGWAIDVMNPSVPDCGQQRPYVSCSRQGDRCTQNDFMRTQECR